MTDDESRCKSCGVPWADHLGIMGVCAENAKLRNERDEARRLACAAMSSGNWDRLLKTTPLSQEAIDQARERGWDCYGQ